MFQNTFVNSTACIGRNGRMAAGDLFGWHASTGPDVEKREGHVFVNNLMTADKGFGRPLLFVWQPESLCVRVPGAQLRQLDNNVAVRAADHSPYPLVLWSPAKGAKCQAGCESLEALHASNADFCEHSRSYANYSGPLFKSQELGNLQLLPGFAGSKVAIKPPAEIVTALGNPTMIGSYVGAYPATR